MPALSDIPGAVAAYVGNRKIWERVINLFGPLKYSVISSSSTVEILAPRSDMDKWENAVRGKKCYIVLNGRRSPGWITSVQYQNDYIVLKFSSGSVGVDGHKGDIARLTS